MKQSRTDSDSSEDRVIREAVIRAFPEHTLRLDKVDERASEEWFIAEPIAAETDEVVFIFSDTAEFVRIEAVDPSPRVGLVQGSVRRWSAVAADEVVLKGSRLVSLLEPGGVLTGCVEARGSAFFEPIEATVSHPQLHQAAAAKGIYEDLAEHDPGALLQLLKGSLEDPVELAWAAEAAGLMEDREQAVSALVGLLSHPAPMVREGAVYGLGEHLTEVVVARLEQLLEGETSEGVKTAIRDVLEG